MTIYSVDVAAVRSAAQRLADSWRDSRPEVVGVVLFGSFARGDAVPGSDVDLLVVLDRDDRRARDRIPDYLPDEFPVGVDVVPWTLMELESRVAARDRMATTVLREGVVLLDRAGTLAALRR